MITLSKDLSKEKRPSAETERPGKNTNSRPEFKASAYKSTASMSSLSNNNTIYKNNFKNNGRLY